MTHTAVRTPAAVFPPGDFLREELAARGWSQAELARRMDNVRVSHTHVAHVLAGDGGISFALARGLALALDTSASFWLNLQTERGRAAPNLRLLARLVLALGVRVDLRPVPGTRWISNRPLTPAERAYARTLVADVEDTNAQ